MQSHEPLMPYEIIIDGATSHSGCQTTYRVTIDGNKIDLPFRLFRILTVLALRRDVDDGWVRGSLLSWAPGLTNKYVSRTRMVLRAAEWRKPGGVDGAWLVIEVNPRQAGHYRLIARPETIRINAGLVDFDDRIVREETRVYLLRKGLPVPERLEPDVDGFAKAFTTFDESDGLGPVVLIELTPKEKDDEPARDK